MSKTPRIALMLQRFSRYGGVEQFGWRLAEALAKEGYEVDFICARKETDPPEGVNVVPVGRVGGLRFFKYLWFLIQAERMRKKGGYDLTFSLAKTWNQDIVRIGGGPLQSFWKLSKEAWPAGIMRAAKQLARHLQPANWLTILVEKRFYRKTPCIIAISDTVRQWIVEEYPHLNQADRNGQSLLTVYNCPDVSRFKRPSEDERAEARKNLGVKPGAYALGLVTTNFALKGVDPLIRALALLPEEYELHVAGGRNPGKYVKLAHSLGLAGRVRFHGKIDTMQQFYYSLDMYVHPTFYDTLGNVVLEALGSGLPTLCSDRAGAAAFLPEDQVIQNPGDPQELATKIACLRHKKDIPPFVPRGAGIDELVEVIRAALTEKSIRSSSSH